MWFPDNWEDPRLDVTDLAKIRVLADNGFKLKKVAKTLDLLGPGKNERGLTHKLNGRATLLACSWSASNRSTPRYRGAESMPSKGKRLENGLGCKRVCRNETFHEYDGLPRHSPQYKCQIGRAHV